MSNEEEPKTRLLPLVYVNDEKKITITEHEWDEKKDHFVKAIEGQVTMPMVHLRKYFYIMDSLKKKEAIVYMFCDDRINPEQCAEIVSTMGPWFYTYGYRSEG